MALTFNGTSQRLDRSGIPYSAYPFTFALWLRPTAALLAGTANGIAMAGVSSGASTSGPYLRVNPNNDRIEAGVSDSVGLSSPTATLSADTWAHAAAVWTSATARTAYLNGIAGSVATTSKTFVVNNVGIRIGARQGGSGSPTDWFGGDLAEAAIWNAALSATDIAALAKGVSPLMIRAANLVFYTPLLGRAAGEPEWIAGTTLAASSGPSQAAHPRLTVPWRGYAPRRSAAAVRVSPPTGALTLAASAPGVLIAEHVRPMPMTASLVLDTYAPALQIGTASPPTESGVWRIEENAAPVGWTGDALRPTQWQVTSSPPATWSSDS